MIIPDDAKRIIEGNPVALATVNGEGSPHVIAVAFVKVVDGKLVITDNYMETTISNILETPNVALAAWDKDWEGYRIEGTAEHHTSGEWLEFAKGLEGNKGEPCKGAVVVTPTLIKKLA